MGAFGIVLEPSQIDTSGEDHEIKMTDLRNWVSDKVLYRLIKRNSRKKETSSWQKMLIICCILHVIFVIASIKVDGPVSDLLSLVTQVLFRLV